MADELTVPEAAAGERLDVFLAGHAGSRAAAQRLIDAGAVTVDGVVRPKRHAVCGGERVVVEPQPAFTPAAEASAPPAPFAVAWEDEHLLLVDKPPGVVVHPARAHRAGTLAQALAGRAAGGPGPRRAGGRPPLPPPPPPRPARRPPPGGARHRPWAGPRDLGPAGRRRQRGGARRAQGAARAAPAGARVPRPGRGPSERAARADRRAARARPACAYARLHRHGRAAPRR